MNAKPTRTQSVMRLRSYAIMCILLAMISMEALGQTPEIIVSRTVIPHASYKSWSLFLVSNPEWILPQSNDKLVMLYRQFRAFGGAIGPSHAAVWFSLGAPKENAMGGTLDILRSAAFGEKLQLPPSKGPYLLITTEYPGKGDLSMYPRTFVDSLKNYTVISLNNMESDDVTRLLSTLADTLVVKGIVRFDTNTEEYWRGWQKSYESLRHALVDMAKNVTIRIKTVFFEADIGL